MNKYNQLRFSYLFKYWFMSGESAKTVSIGGSWRVPKTTKLNFLHFMHIIMKVKNKKLK